MTTEEINKERQERMDVLSKEFWELKGIDEEPPPDTSWRNLLQFVLYVFTIVIGLSLLLFFWHWIFDVPDPAKEYYLRGKFHI